LPLATLVHPYRVLTSGFLLFRLIYVGGEYGRITNHGRG
jgi:hypothetical protein